MVAVRQFLYPFFGNLKVKLHNVTVAMDKNKYIQEATLMLSDKKTYEPLKRDPTNVIHNKVNNLMKLWKDKNYVNENTANSLKSSNLLPARFYGLPKIHKVNFALRPIVSFCGSPTYNLASFYNKIISNNIPPRQSHELKTVSISFRKSKIFKSLQTT